MSLRQSTLHQGDVRDKFPKVNRNRRSENEAFMQGVIWVLRHLVSYRFAEDVQTDGDRQNNSLILEAAERKADEIYPDWEPGKSATKQGF